MAAVNRNVRRRRKGCRDGMGYARQVATLGTKTSVRETEVVEANTAMIGKRAVTCWGVEAEAIELLEADGVEGVTMTAKKTETEGKQGSCQRTEELEEDARVAGGGWGERRKRRATALRRETRGRRWSGRTKWMRRRIPATKKQALWRGAGGNGRRTSVMTALVAVRARRTMTATIALVRAKGGGRDGMGSARVVATLGEITSVRDAEGVEANTAMVGKRTITLGGGLSEAAELEEDARVAGGGWGERRKRRATALRRETRGRRWSGRTKWMRRRIPATKKQALWRGAGGNGRRTSVMTALVAVRARRTMTAKIALVRVRSRRTMTVTKAPGRMRAGRRSPRWRVTTTTRRTMMMRGMTVMAASTMIPRAANIMKMNL